MTQHHIVFLDRASVKANVRRPAFDHGWKEHEKTTADEVVSKLRDATIALVNKVPMRGDTLAKLPKLKMIAVAATGTDNVDLEYCRKNGIAVANIRNYAVHTVPEHAFSMI
ncbi:MAG: glycerate dehydrogenase, partial [Burkholderiales bacterium]|nr:glycerate dehydrogenase [Burkholderiales bacterium]